MTENIPSHKEYIDQKLQQSRDSYQINSPQHIAGLLAQKLKPLWLTLGNIESEYLRPQLDKISLDAPVYISGLARSGTTILLETLHHTGLFGSYTYTHYPFIYFPLIWKKIAKAHPAQETRERTHFDRIQVRPDSPEALEEMIWRSFFPSLFDEDDKNIFSKTTSHSKFEHFYTDNLKKCLFMTKRRHYLAKGNYNFARIPYILKIIPSAKFVLCIRDPKNHIASLVKQHYLFSRIEQDNPRALQYMEWIGHNEFGLNRHPIYLGRQDAYQKIVNAWSQGHEIEGWARQWSYIYHFIHHSLLQNPEIAPNIYMLKYEDLCANPDQELEKIYYFCQIKPLPEKYNVNISAPTYYQNTFSNEENMCIDSLTKETKSLYYS